jgi:hypothetical protein
MHVQPIPLWIQSYTGQSGSAKFVVTTLGIYPKGAFPTHMIHDAILDTSFRQLQQDYAKQKFTLTFVKDLDVNGFPGREYKAINDTGDRVGRIRIYSTPKLGMSFVAMDTPGETAERQFDVFFNSIKLDTTEPSAP